MEQIRKPDPFGPNLSKPVALDRQGLERLLPMEPASPASRAVLHTEPARHYAALAEAPLPASLLTAWHRWWRGDNLVFPRRAAPLFSLERDRSGVRALATANHPEE